MSGSSDCPMMHFLSQPWRTGKWKCRYHPHSGCGSNSMKVEAEVDRRCRAGRSFAVPSALFDQIKSGRVSVRPAGAFLGEERLVLEAHAHAGVPPFRDDVRRAELDRIDGVRIERVFARCRERSSASRPFRASCPSRGRKIRSGAYRCSLRSPRDLAFCQRGDEDLVPFPALLHLAEQDLLQPVALLEQVLQSLGRVGLARASGHRRCAACPWPARGSGSRRRSGAGRRGG